MFQHEVLSCLLTAYITTFELRGTQHFPSCWSFRRQFCSKVWWFHFGLCFYTVLDICIMTFLPISIKGRFYSQISPLTTHQISWWYQSIRFQQFQYCRLSCWSMHPGSICQLFVCSCSLWFITFRPCLHCTWLFNKARLWQSCARPLPTW